MAGIKIISDSTSDLSKELIERYNVSILPLHVLLSDEEFEDGVNIDPDRIFAWSDETKETPKTSAPSIEEAVKLFGSMLQEYDEIITFSISDSMSSSGNVMRMAAQELEAEERIHVVDSANLSTGIGLLILGAAERAQAGVPTKEILAWIEEVKPRVRASFVVDTLTYLHRGGRCSGVAALAGGVLRLHPRIAVVNGAMRPEKKYRGRMRHVIMDYVKDMEEDLKKAEPEHVFLTHARVDRELLDAIMEYLTGLGRFKEIHITQAGGVISSHCGPGALGVLFIAGKENAD